jgi:hypothetical protein
MTPWELEVLVGMVETPLNFQEFGSVPAFIAV